MCEKTDSRCTTTLSKPRGPLMSWRFEPAFLIFFAGALPDASQVFRG